MNASTVSPGSRVAAFARKPAVRRSLIGIAAFLLLYGLFGRFVLPGIIQSQAQQLIAEQLHRQASIGKVEVEPFALRVTVRDFSMKEAQGEAVFASFDALTLDMAWSSLLRFAPIVQAVRLDKPYVRIARTGANAYSIDDLLALARQPAPAAEEDDSPARFAVYNIQVEEGRIVFEDVPAGDTHTVDALRIGVPFISSLHSQEEVFVEPMLSAQVNGTPLLLTGKARPFADQREAVVDLNLEGLDLRRFVDYLPFKPAFTLAGARLDTRLEAAFVQPHDQAPSLTLSGTAALRELQLDAPGGQPFLRLPALRLTLDRTPLLGSSFRVARLEADGLEIKAVRDAQGRIDLQRLLAVTVPPQAASAVVAAAPAPPAAIAATQAAAPLAPSATPAKPAAQTARPAGMRVLLDEFALRGAALHYRDMRADAPMSAGMEKFDATVRALALDTGTRQVRIGEIASGSAAFQVVHERPQAGARSAVAAQEAATGAAAPAAGGREEGAYVIAIDSIAIDNWQARLEDRGHAKPAVTQLAAVGFVASALSTAPGQRGSIALKAGVNRGGQLALEGKLGIAPLHADLRLDLKEVDLLPLQPYLTDKVNLLLTRASLSGRGALQLDQAADGTLTGGYKGDATLGNLATVDKLSGSDFLRWKSLHFGGVDARFAPFALAIGQVALTDFFARVIIDPSGRINLQDIARGQGGGQQSLTERTAQAAPAPSDSGAAAMPSAASSASVAPASAASAAADTGVTATAAASPTAPPVPAKAPAVSPVTPVKIGKLTLQGGRVRFTDNFIQPNYTATLESLGGVVQGLSSDPASRATLDLRGQVNSAPLTVAGSINPLRGDLAMDVQASVRDMELAPLSPYSGRYIGYGIEKGKLSFEVAYKVDQRQLTAENRLILDQLTFGDQVDSPDALKLPVQLAVALLRDRNGVIDINLPVAGSLDDPQFSVGAIVGKVFVNLVTKAVTAPFALLGALFGGGEELSWMEFEAGHAAIPPAGEAKLKTLAKALAERPALKLEIAARAGGDAEIEGMKRAAMQRKLRALKQKDMAARNEAAPAGGVVVRPEEYPALLKRVYQEEKFPKPRNVIGMQKDLPVAEMEKLMIANAQVDADDLTALGNRRAQAVKEWLMKNGQIPGERIFILATRSAAAEQKAGAEPQAGAATVGKDGKDKEPGPSRVDFSLK